MEVPMATASANPTTTLTRADARASSEPASVGNGMAARVVPKPNGKAPAETVDGRDSYAVTAFAEIVDRSLHATAARFTFGLSPAALAEAYLDWATHLAFSPGKWM